MTRCPLHHEANATKDNKLLANKLTWPTIPYCVGPGGFLAARKMTLSCDVPTRNMSSVYTSQNKFSAPGFAR